MSKNTGSIIRPLLMVAFVFSMIFLMQKNIEEKEELIVQQNEIDPSSVIYADLESIEVIEEDFETIEPAEGDTNEDPSSSGE